MGTQLGWPLLLDGPEPPGDPIGVLQSESPEPERAAALRQLAEAAAGQDPRTLDQYACGLLAYGLGDDAEQLWLRLLADRPDMAVARLNLATCHLAAGRLDECARVLQACRDGAGPDTPERAMAERRLTELDEARQTTARRSRLQVRPIAGVRP
jgi:hypothetical protein